MLLYNYSDMQLEDCDKNSENKTHMVTFQQDYAVTLQITEGEVLGINDWIIEKCNSTQEVEYQKQNLPKKIINMAELESKTSVITRDVFTDTLFLEVQPRKKVNLYLEFQAGDIIYFNNWLSKVLFDLKNDFSDPLSSTKLIELIEQGVITYRAIEYPKSFKTMVKSNRKNY